MSNTIAREKEIKGWLRVKKVALIEASNPTWKDLYPALAAVQEQVLRRAQDDNSKAFTPAP